MTSSVTPFTPDWVSPPGDTIADMIEERGWLQYELASRLGYSTKHISLLINGKEPVTEDTAQRLERVLGGSTRFWLTREAHYRAQLVRSVAFKRYESWIPWLDNFPVKELMQLGIISKRRRDQKGMPALVEELLRFFGVASPEEWYKYYQGMEVYFHRTRVDQSDTGAILAWLRMGEIQAEKMNTPRFDRDAFLNTLKEIRTLTVLPAEVFSLRLQDLCLKSGVTFLLVPQIPRAHVSGVARWLSPRRPLIQLSLYGKLNDHFWFSFFHEAAHILLHEGKEVFLDDLDGKSNNLKEEKAANNWARDFLIPVKYSADLNSIHSMAAVQAFAEIIGIHPGIVVGRLQHDGLIPVNWMNRLKVSLRLKEPD